MCSLPTPAFYSVSSGLCQPDRSTCRKSNVFMNRITGRLEGSLGKQAGRGSLTVEGDVEDGDPWIFCHSTEYCCFVKLLFLY